LGGFGSTKKMIRKKTPKQSIRISSAKPDPIKLLIVFSLILKLVGTAGLSPALSALY
jgi:hypothetical protein